MKKIISLLSAVAMLAMAAVPVSAALEYELDGEEYVVYDFPTSNEVAEYAIDVDVSVSEKAADADTLKTWGGRTLKSEFEDVFDQYDFYKVTYTATGLGTLVVGWDGNGKGTALFGLYSIRVGHNGSVLPAGTEIRPIGAIMGDNSEDSDSLLAGVDKSDSKLNITYANSAFYPAMNKEETGVLDTTGTIKLEYVVALPAGEYVEVPFVDGKVDYKAKSDTVNSDGLFTTKVTAEAFAIGEKAQEPDEPGDDEGDQDIIISDRLTLENLGYAWDVTINNYDSNKTYTATFTAPGESDKVNDLILSGAEADNGTIAFAALLKTTKANVELAIAKN